MATRKMKALAAKAEKRAESRGEKRQCSSCGGKPKGTYVAIDPQSGDVLGIGSICDPPEKKDLH